MGFPLFIGLLAVLAAVLALWPIAAEAEADRLDALADAGFATFDSELSVDALIAAERLA